MTAFHLSGIVSVDDDRLTIFVMVGRIISKHSVDSESHSLSCKSTEMSQGVLLKSDLLFTILSVKYSANSSATALTDGRAGPFCLSQPVYSLEQFLLITSVDVSDVSV